MARRKDGMIKLVGALHRLSDQSREQCLAHFRERHGPLVRASTDYSRHVSRYVQFPRVELDGLSEPMSDGFSGASQLWFRDLATFRLAYAERAYWDVIAPDVRRFVNQSRSLVVIGTEENLVAGGDEAPVRLYRFVPAPADMSPADFQTFRFERHGKAIVEDPAIRALLAGFVQTFSLPPEESPFESPASCAGVDEFRFAGTDDLRAFLAREITLVERLGVDPMRMGEIATSFHVVI